DAPDNVQCFHCGFELTGWEQSDDPFSEHYAHQPSCAYAKLHCQTREALAGNKVEWVGWPVGKGGDDREQKARLLDMRNDVAMRLETFTTNEWPHTGRVDWNVTPEKLAKAGFYYTPEWWGDDTATCQFCGYALAEWEADDDPNAEHERRVPDCLFFTLVKEKAAKLVSSPLPKGTPRRVSMRTSMQAADVSTLEPDHQDESDDSSASKRQRIDEALIERETEEQGHEHEHEHEHDQHYGDNQRLEAEQRAAALQEKASESSTEREHGNQAVAEDDEESGQEHEDQEIYDQNESDDEEDDDDKDEHEDGDEDREGTENSQHVSDNIIEAHGGYGGDDGGEQMSLGSDSGQNSRMDVHLSPDVSVGADVDDDSEDEGDMGRRTTSTKVKAKAKDQGQSTQMSQTQVVDSQMPGSPVEMMVDDEYQQSTQVEGAAGYADAWSLTEEEENMTVEEFIRACCDQKVASLEASAAQMISSFTQRAEHTRERIYNMPW
ncbi:hypothetical protein J3B02_003881, partial [Coemansia erecta]